VVPAAPSRLGRRELIFALCDKFVGGDSCDLAKSENFLRRGSCTRSVDPIGCRLRRARSASRSKLNRRTVGGSPKSDG
jgi:hypothetical protein